ncbi:FAD-binding oxidoreductase [Blastococcus sp. BMG 814]|uniref:FAD-binding oxidoreductase n=1 Tax=Blastococcus carthaginiensis TaxID=3050034 RepID=A0ABT9IBL0_9ACTN|nr:FAD-binding oxidoreductase [Blastococcus carthaginiensis]MDP5182958.1 FAD-binding oxidoreductase [Blastococcus carthaginiensis]
MTTDPTVPGPPGLWFDTLPGAVVPRPSLSRDIDADVAVVGAGFTGLWTAYYLARADPTLRIVVLEAEVAGFGASGRNGGWCSALFAASRERIARTAGRQAAVDLHRELRRTVDEVGRVAAVEGIDAQYVKGGTLAIATRPEHVAALQAEVEHEHAWGAGAEDVAWLDAAETAGRVRTSTCLGGVFTPHCARVHPARLVRGLADVVERAGVTVHERTRVTRIGPRVAETAHGRVRADVVIRATEGYTATLAGHRRALAPVYSLMIATEPLPPGFWDEVGWAGRETVTDGRNLIIYAQRTADDRIALGGRGAPYHYASSVLPGHDGSERVFAALRRTLVDLFPAAADARTTHRWGGPLGVPRDWMSSVGLDRRTGLAWAGGYVGDGVATSNLAGRTLADLVLQRDSDLVHLPWVGHRSPHWEPEPLRWLGINGGLQLAGLTDAIAARTGRPARRTGQLLARLTGG